MAASKYRHAGFYSALALSCVLLAGCGDDHGPKFTAKEAVNSCMAENNLPVCDSVIVPFPGEAPTCVVSSTPGALLGRTRDVFVRRFDLELEQMTETDNNGFILAQIPEASLPLKLAQQMKALHGCVEAVTPKGVN